MPRHRLLFGFAVIAITLCSGTLVNAATENEIYKWTDEEGNVHYRDRPSGEPSEVRIGISYNRTDNSVVQRQLKARLDSQAAREERRDALDEADRAAEEEAAAAVDRQEKCDSYRASLERYAQSQRLYHEGADGERTYLDDNEKIQETRRLEDLVAKNCSN